MKLTILLPFQVFSETPDVLRIVVETIVGSYGLLPQRLDCVAALAPGILTYQTAANGEIFVAVDEGVLIKTGPDVMVSVRRALGGTELEALRDAVDTQYLTLNDAERDVQSVMAKLETGFLHRFTRLQHE